MRKSVLIVFVVLVCGLGVTETALALRCGSRIVSRGDSKAKVRRVCGEPDYRHVSGGPTGEPAYLDRNFDSRTQRHEGLSINYSYEMWVYDFGDARFVYVITFSYGRVHTIRTETEFMGPEE